MHILHQTYSHTLLASSAAIKINVSAMEIVYIDSRINLSR